MKINQLLKEICSDCIEMENELKIGSLLELLHDKNKNSCINFSALLYL